MKQLLTLITSLLISTSAYAVSAASAAEPFTPDETIPTGLESVPKNLTTSINVMSSLSANLNIPELGVFKSGLQMYVSNRQTCLQDQARAATFCREETSPDLQKTMAGLNLVLAGVNSVAINDACKSFSKAMTVAQLGITAYTVACGLLRKKCNMSCAAAANGMKQIIKGLVATGATCKLPADPSCAASLAELDRQKKFAYEQVKLEASLSDKKSLHSKERLCQHTYGLLLVSSGVSLLSVAKSLKEGKNCDEQSHSEGSGGSVASAAPVATAATTTTTASNETTTPTPSSETPKEVERIPTSTPDVAIEKRIEINKDPEPVVNSELREYLPGGRKAVVAGNSSTTYPEITGPGGKSNFEKMRIRFRELRLDAD